MSLGRNRLWHKLLQEDTRLHTDVKFANPSILYLRSSIFTICLFLLLLKNISFPHFIQVHPKSNTPWVNALKTSKNKSTCQNRTAWIARNVKRKPLLLSEWRFLRQTKCLFLALRDSFKESRTKRRYQFLKKFNQHRFFWHLKTT